jgi:hypothetical protein
VTYPGSSSASTSSYFDFFRGFDLLHLFGWFADGRNDTTLTDDEGTSVFEFVVTGRQGNLLAFVVDDVRLYTLCEGFSVRVDDRPVVEGGLCHFGPWLLRHRQLDVELVEDLLDPFCDSHSGGFSCISISRGQSSSVSRTFFISFHSSSFSLDSAHRWAAFPPHKRYEMVPQADVSEGS